MSKTLTEMTAEIVAAQAAHASMSPEEMQEALNRIFEALKGIRQVEEGAVVEEAAAGTQPAQMDPKKSILRNKVICLECGREFKIITSRHLKEHGLTGKEYRKKYGFTARQALSAKSLTEARRKNALDRGLGDILKTARQKKAAPSQKATEAAPEKKAMRRRKKVENVPVPF